MVVDRYVEPLYHRWWPQMCAARQCHKACRDILLQVVKVVGVFSGGRADTFALEY